MHAYKHTCVHGRNYSAEFQHKLVGFLGKVLCLQQIIGSGVKMEFLGTFFAHDFTLL